MALTQVSTEGIKNGTITGSDLATNVDLVDNQKLRFGTSSEKSEIYNDGDDLFINHTEAGYLQLQGNYGVLIQRHNGTENLLRALSNGAVELFYDNNKKFETTSTGVQVDGGLTVSSDYPTINLFDTNNNDFRIQNRNGVLSFVDVDNSDVVRFAIDSGNAKNSMAGTLAVGTLELADNAKAKFGTGDDLQIYHDSANSLIDEVGTGILGLRSDTGINLYKLTGNEFMLKAIPDGAVELYYDNVKKLRTQSGGVTFEGTDSGGNVSHGRFYYKVESGTVKALYDPNGGKFQLYDSVHASFGNSHDLQIYHNGSHSYIENSTGTLVIRNTHAGTVKIQGVTGEQSIVATANGSVDLYYDNSKKLETTSTGVQISGHINLPDHASGTGKIKFGDGNDLQIYHDGSNSFLTNGTGYLLVNSTGGDNVIRSSNDVHLQPASGESGVTANANGAVELYYDNTKKLETEDAGVRVTGRLNMQVNSNTTYPTSFGTNAYVPFAHELVIDNNVGGAQGSFAGIFFNAGADTDGSKVGTARISAVETGNYKADLVFATRSTGFSEKARITHNGVLMIGATSTLSNETRLTVRNDTEAKVSTFHHNHNSQRSCIDCQNDYAAGSNSAIMIEFRRDNGTSVGGIFASTSNVSYNTASDYRLKENQVAISDGITRLKELKPYKFNFKENKDKIVDGFFAHEVSSVVPEAITGTKDEVDENNDPVYQGIDQSKLVPLLVASLQEAIGKIEVLEKEVAALKAS